MKIIFLDVDGVLNYLEEWSRQPDKGTYVLAPECVERLIALVNATGASIVLSSTWRQHQDHVDYLKEQGALPNLHEDWRTGWTKRGSNFRGWDIQEWLERHPEVTDYVILDDNSDMLDSQLPNFVQTSFEGKGFDIEHLTQAIVILTRRGDGPVEGSGEGVLQVP